MKNAFSNIFEKEKLNQNFIVAAADDNVEKVFLAMVKGADVNTVSWDNGFNALHWAMRNASFNMMSVLVDITGHNNGRVAGFPEKNRLINKHADNFGGKESLRNIWKIQASQININHRDYTRASALKYLPEVENNYAGTDERSVYLKKIVDYWHCIEDWSFAKHCNAMKFTKYVDKDNFTTLPASPNQIRSQYKR